MRVLAICALSFCGAVFLSQYMLATELNIIAAAVFAGVGLAGLLLKGKKRTLVILTMFSAVFALLYCSLYSIIFFKPAEDMAGTVKEIDAEIINFSEQRDYGLRVEAKLKTTGSAAVKAVLYIYDDTIDELKPGDNVKLTARLALSNEMYGSKNDTYPSKGIYLFAYQVTSGKIEVEYCDGVKLKYVPQYIAAKLSDTCEKVFFSSSVPFMKSLLIGGRAELYEDEKTVNDLQISGIFHIVAVSGMHIVFLAGFITLLCVKNKKLAAVISAPTLIIYMFMTGMTPSVQRAVIMQLFVIAAPLFYRESDSVTSISAALMLILMLNPYSAKSIGLQLSFAATLGIILQAGKMNDAIMSKTVDKLSNKRKLMKRALSMISACIATSLSAMIFTVPLTAIYFGYVSLIAVVTNLLTFCLVPVCFAMGLVAGVVGMLFAPLGAAIGIVPSIAAELIITMGSAMARVKFAAVYVSNPYITIWIVLIYALVLLSIIFKSGFRGVITSCLIAGISFCIVTLVSQISFNNTDVELTALDVGQGQCVIINSGGRVVMIDCGSDYDNAGKIASEYLLGSGYNRVDLFIATHFDDDHVNGLETLANGVQIAAVAVPDFAISDTEMPTEIETIAEANDIELITVSENMRITVNGLDINLFAMSAIGSYTDENDGGLVALASKNGFDVLITGDISSGAERDFIAYAALPDVEVIIAGHHGSKYSTCEEYLDAVAPEIAVISVGHNSYGHPTDEVLKRLTDRDIVVLRTDLQGNVSLRSQ